MSRREIDPFGVLHQLRREMDRVLDSFAGSGGRVLPFVGRHEPPINVWEDADRVCVEVEIPVLSIDDINVHMSDDGLRVSGERPKVESADVTYHRRERMEGEFEREIRMPAPVNSDQASAVLKDGLLTITLPKSESTKPHRITVQGE